LCRLLPDEVASLDQRSAGALAEAPAPDPHLPATDTGRQRPGRSGEESSLF
jgi:hypothetical protein